VVKDQKAAIDAAMKERAEREKLIEMHAENAHKLEEENKKLKKTVLYVGLAAVVFLLTGATITF
jgi:hypothetical protein